MEEPKLSIPIPILGTKPSIETKASKVKTLEEVNYMLNSSLLSQPRNIEMV